MSETNSIDVPGMCLACGVVTLHRRGVDGQFYCMACVTRATQTPLQRYALPPREHVVTVQQTSKQYKAGQLIGIAGLVIGIVLISNDVETGGVAVLALGIATWFLSRMAAWWHHG